MMVLRISALVLGVLLSLFAVRAHAADVAASQVVEVAVDDGGVGAVEVEPSR